MDLSDLLGQRQICVMLVNAASISDWTRLSSCSTTLKMLCDRSFFNTIEDFIGSKEFRDPMNDKRRDLGRSIGKRLVMKEVDLWLSSGGNPADVTYGAALAGKKFFSRKYMKYYKSMRWNNIQALTTIGVIPKCNCDADRRALLRGAIENGTSEILHQVAKILHPGGPGAYLNLAKDLAMIGLLDEARKLDPTVSNLMHRQLKGMLMYAPYQVIEAHKKDITNEDLVVLIENYRYDILGLVLKQPLTWSVECAIKNSEDLSLMLAREINMRL